MTANLLISPWRLGTQSYYSIISKDFFSHPGVFLSIKAKNPLSPLFLPRLFLWLWSVNCMHGRRLTGSPFLPSPYLFSSRLVRLQSHHAVIVLQEIAVLRSLSYDRNLVQFYGACLEREHAMLVLEYMEGGGPVPGHPGELLPPGHAPAVLVPEGGDHCSGHRQGPGLSAPEQCTFPLQFGLSGQVCYLMHA